MSLGDKVKKLFAVVLTAGLALPTVATTAAAQDETITIEGLVYLDRNANRKPDAGESPRVGTRIWAMNLDTRKIKWESTTGADGRYKAVLPKGPKYSVGLDFGDYTANRSEWVLSESHANADFAFAGYFVEGFTFVDTNGDGEKQEDEKTHEGKVKVTGRSNSGTEVNVETRSGVDGAYRLDLPLGEYQVVAPDLTANQLALAAPKSDRDIDWVTGTRKFPTGNDGARNYRVDLRYLEAKADIGLASAITPVKDVYTVGDQIDVKFTLSNKGNVPVAPDLVLGSFYAKLVSHSDNVKLQPGSDDDFTVVNKILPGQQIEVALKVELNDVKYNEVHALVRFNYGRLPDVDHKNNVVSTKIKVVEKSTAEPSAPSSTSATAVPTTTTTPAVAKAGNNSDLASTGASPLGFLGLGALLLAAGTGAFFVARRRRS